MIPTMPNIIAKEPKIIPAILIILFISIPPLLRKIP